MRACLPFLLPLLFLGLEAEETDEVDQSALIALWKGFDPNWYIWDTTTGLCGQGGITCSSGKVTNLTMSDRAVIGTIATEIGDLTSMMYLDFNTNSLGGTIPTEIGRLTNLKFINFDFNKLSGSLPTQIGLLINLESITLSENGLSGSIPTQIGSLTKLAAMQFSGNSLSGSIPTEIGLLTNLSGIFHYSNRLSGTIPTQIEALKQLFSVMLHENSLSGTIPQAFATRPLGILTLAYNRLEGTVPHDLAYSQHGLTSMLTLAGNLFQCPVPDYSRAPLNDYSTSARDCERSCSPNPCEEGGKCIALPGSSYDCVYGSDDSAASAQGPSAFTLLALLPCSLLAWQVGRR